MTGFTQQIKGFTIGYIKEQAIGIVGGVLNKFLHAYKAPYRVIVVLRRPGEPPELQVVAKIQEPIEMKISSRWEPFLPTITAPLVRALAQKIGQGIMGVPWTPTLVMATQRVWISTEPMSVRLKLAFAEDSDVRGEVVDMCRRLQMLAAPGKIGPCLTAPGPAPMGEGGMSIFKAAGGEIRPIGKITVGVGTFLHFPSVIIKEVEVSFHPRMSSASVESQNLPIFAIANVTFETYEVVTREQISGGGDVPSGEAIYSSIGARQTDKSFLDKAVDYIGDLGGSSLGGIIGDIGSVLRK